MSSFALTIKVKEKGRTSPFWNLQGDLWGNLTFQDLLVLTKKALITISSDVLREEQGRGFDLKPLVLVDGKFNKDVGDVSPLGKIQYVSRQDIREVVEFAFQKVFELSPVLTGEYLDNNAVYLNGQYVADSPASVKSWLDGVSFKNGDKVRIVNLAPYARKLELEGVRSDTTRVKWGKGSKRGLGRKNDQGKVRIPNGAYTVASRLIKRQWGRNAFIKFELMSGSSMGLTSEARRRQTGKDGSGALGKGKGRPYVYPSILIYAFETSGPDKGTMQ